MESFDTVEEANQHIQNRIELGDKVETFTVIEGTKLSLKVLIDEPS